MCKNCGLEINADINACLNIARKAVDVLMRGRNK
ncbi:zinc ribbon domain-containing protein [Infirmifilum uzonense]|nr:zinc ribbon domain-containing protein [Infirmifilum uzonense]